jgi:DNA-binding XRE family transcriptional regulator
MVAGRPPKFESVESLQKQIDAYFADCVAKDEPYTITGLALALDTTRQTLINYEEKDEYLDTIKKAKTMVEQYAEKRLFTGTPTGAIFALKNFGWKDKQETELTGKDGKDLNPSLNEDDRELLKRFVAQTGEK